MAGSPRRCAVAACRVLLPPTRKAKTCRDCMNGYTQRWREANAEQTVRFCQMANCRALLPPGRISPSCRKCMTAYQRKRRGKDRLERLPNPEKRYCSTCGLPFPETGGCCPTALPIPAIPWCYWLPEQLTIALHLKWVKGVMDVEKMALKLGVSVRRILRQGRKLGTPNGALVSPFLYTDNALGKILFLTTRAQDGEE